MNKNLSQMPAAISAAMAASMGNLKAALVGAIGGAQSRCGGQFQQCAQQPSQPSNGSLTSPAETTTWLT